MELSKARIAKYALLKHKKYRDREGLFIVQGEKAVRDTMSYFELEALIDNTDAIRKISTLDNLPTVIAVFKMPRKSPNLRVTGNKFVLVLDGVQDPGNLGTILRTAHWFGVDKIFCSEDTVDLYNPKTVMSTMGSIAKLEVQYCNLTDLFRINLDLPVYGLLLEGDNIFKVSNLKPGFIVMGNEGHGLSEITLRRLTQSLTIPPSNPENHPESLNVAIATAITLSQLIQ